MMNTFKKIETASLTLSAILCLCVALFVVGCGDSGTFAGTSEETNEMAENISSNSVDEESSSSFDVQEPHPESISSSAQKTSSSSRVVSSSSRVASSSSRTLSSSSARISSSSQEHSSSSSKQKDNTNTSKYSSSSFDGDTHTPPIHEQDPNSNSLDSYLKLFKLDSGSFDGGVLSATFDVSESVIPGDPVDNPPTASATEFDGPWPHKFVKQNIVALGHFFPNAEKEYSDIVNAIKNDTLDANCGLYMLNVYGDGKAAGFVLANIVKDTITVLDISAGRCEPSSGRMERFLFYYCGEIDSRPEIVHILVENNLSAGCPVLKNEEEWVKDKSQTP
jgi:hypothetical protein